MKGSLIPHLLTFSLGVVVSFVFIYAINDDHNTSNIIDENSSFRSKKISDQLESTPDNTKDYQKIIDDKNRQITELKRQLLANSNTSQTAPQAKQQDQETQLAESKDSEQKLKKMTFKDFEDSMKESFTDRFKGVVIELSGERLEDLKRAFSQSEESNEKSIEYENSISNFLAENNSDGDHFIQSLQCNTHICRLEVNTNNNNSWNSLYASMTQQSWYKSITVQEASEYPGNIIYYLPNMNN